MENIKFSVIVPVYNTSKYLNKCFDSLVSQTFKSFEVIIVNDGSTDNSLDICKAYEQKDNRFRVISTKNQGVSVARNQGMSEASGDYITFLDSDDYLELNTLELISEQIKINNYDIIQCNLSIDYNNTKRKYFNLQSSFEVENKKEILESIISIKYGATKYGNKYLNCRCIGGKFYNKRLIDKNNLKFPAGIKAFEDGIFNLYAYHYADKILILKDALYHYIQYNLQSTALYYDNQLYQNELILSEIKRFINTSKIDLINIYDYSVFELYYVTIDKIIRLQKNVSIRKKLNEIKSIYLIPLYNESINRLDKSKLKLIDKIVYTLTLNNHYLTLYLLFIIKKIIKNIRR